MDFDLPREITEKLAELDAFIEAEIKPMEHENRQFFDHRREHARTDWDHDGRPRAEWRALISEMECRADKVGHLRYGLPKSCGGSAASNLAIAAIREHLAAKGLGLHNDLQDESSIVGNFPIIPAIADYGTPEQKTYIEGIITGKKHISFGLTEPGHAGNYFKRQISRWSGLWGQYRRGDEDNPDLDRVVRWLAERVPESETLALCHGDFRIANVMFHKAEPRVIGVLPNAARVGRHLARAYAARGLALIEEEP